MSQTRQLAAIMFTDIVGYTALMGKDEQKAVAILKQNRQIQRPLIERHNGKWLKEMGDGILASFHTVSDAVYCALEIQSKCKKEAGFLLRIGIHLGEVLFEKGDVFGDGVNIASRLQTIAPPGDILVSESVYRNIANKKGLEAEFLREEMLKNIDSPIKVYRVKLKSGADTVSDQILHQPTHSTKNRFSGRKKIIAFVLAVAILLIAGILLYGPILHKKEISSEKSATPTEKKSIAVLPFRDLSPNHDQEYLGDGIAEEILNVLNNMMKDLNVTGRRSSFSFKGKETDLKTIGKILNVKSILEGSVQKSGNQISISVQLINAEDGYQIWVQKYVRELKDIFSIQDEIAAKVGEKLKLTLFEDKPNPELRTINTEAYENVLKGNFYFNKGPENFEKAVEYHKKAIQIDTAYAYPYIRLGWAIYQQTLANQYSSRAGFAMARKAIEKGLAMVVTPAEKHSAHFALAFINLWEYKWENALDEYEKALEINPKRNDFYAFYQSLALGKTSEALPIFKKVVEENPVDVLSLRDFALLQYLDKEFTEAISTCNKILELNPSFSEAYRIKGSVFSAEKKFDLALENLRKAAELGNPFAQLQTITTLPLAGKKEEARKSFLKLDSIYADRIPAFARVLVYYNLGESDKAFEWLNQSYNERDFWLASLRVDPLWDPLRFDPRFKRLMKKMNFPD